MRYLLVVRHGESTWNAGGRWQGQADPPLSALGERQARAAAGRLEAIDAIWSSDLERARRTAEIVAEQFDLAVRLDRRLRERDAGDWTGLTRSEIERQFPGALAEARSPSGFEADEHVVARGLDAVGAIAANLPAGGSALVVTHGGMIRTLERHLGASPEPVANLMGRWIEHGADGLALGARELLIDPEDVTVQLPHQL